VAVGSSDATCLAIDTAKPTWSKNSGTGCVAAAKDDATCAAIETAKGKWDGSKCVKACVCTGTDVCSKVGTAAPITCVAVGSSDATCLAIDTAKPKFKTGTGCVTCEIAAECTCGDVCSATDTCVAPGSSDATCAAISTATPIWSAVQSKCIADVCDTAAKKVCADAWKTDCSPGATACGACMSGYTADSSGVCKKDATPEPAAPSPSDDHHGHDHGSPSAADVSSATTMSPASMLTALAMLVAYVMH